RARVPLGAVVSEAVTRTGLDTEVTVAEGVGGEVIGGDVIDGEADAARTVETDPRRLERIVSNLVVNAHRHGDTPVRVTVEGGAVADTRRPGPPIRSPDTLRRAPFRTRRGVLVTAHSAARYAPHTMPGIAAAATNLTKVYGSGDTRVVALDQVSIDFREGEFT